MKVLRDAPLPCFWPSATPVAFDAWSDGVPHGVLNRSVAPAAVPLTPISDDEVAHFVLPRVKPAHEAPPSPHRSIAP